MYEQYSVAMQAAKSQQKPLLVYLHRRNCHACDYMENQVFTDENVAAYLSRNYVVVRLYTNDSGLPADLRVEMSPVFHFLNSDNREIIESIIGGRDAERFLRLLQSCYKDYKDETSGDYRHKLTLH